MRLSRRRAHGGGGPEGGARTTARIAVFRLVGPRGDLVGPPVQAAVMGVVVSPSPPCCPRGAYLGRAGGTTSWRVPFARLGLAYRRAGGGGTRWHYHVLLRSHIDCRGVRALGDIYVYNVILPVPVVSPLRVPAIGCAPPPPPPPLPPPPPPRRQGWAVSASGSGGPAAFRPAVARSPRFLGCV